MTKISFQNWTNFSQTIIENPTCYPAIGTQAVINCNRKMANIGYYSVKKRPRHCSQVDEITKNGTTTANVTVAKAAQFGSFDTL
ncbi:hypothetical protein OS189_12110 [Sulfitobacter sp. F26169L]|uniref:hypothetical protein n=1 Tax=Sulfitobacter sp. F26169L TaxID=2996015 RepID=UPI002260B561|nr:hypothetical protein [Sulfitobacter sp. F26169L]MCX7567087.1 hypothetical protein [Sulfitobacter sp. F26169L]